MGVTDLRDRFEKFHRENPQVYVEFKKLAEQMQKTGRERYAAWTIVNVIRWHMDLGSTGDDFKINNNYIALYARKLIRENPKFKGFFQLRKMKH